MALTPEEIDAAPFAPIQNRSVAGLTLTPETIDNAPSSQPPVAQLSPKDIDAAPFAPVQTQSQPSRSPALPRSSFRDDVSDAWERVKALPSQIARTRIEETPEEERPSEYTERVAEGGWPAALTTSPLKLLHPAPTDEERANQLRTLTSGYTVDAQGREIPNVPVGQKPLSAGERIALGVGDTADDTLSFMTSPAGAIMLGIGALPKIAQRLISAGFAAQMASQLPGRYQAIKTELSKPEGQRNYQAIGQQASGAAVDLGFAGLGAIHATKGIGLDVPAINRMLSKESVQEFARAYGKDDLKTMFARVQSGEATPDETAYYNWLTTGTPRATTAPPEIEGVAVKGAKTTSTPILPKWLSDFLGVKPDWNVGLSRQELGSQKLLTAEQIDNTPAAAPQPGGPSAPNTIVEQTGVPSESQRTPQVRQETEAPSPGSRLPSTTGQPTTNVQGRSSAVPPVGPSGQTPAPIASAPPAEPVPAVGWQPFPSGAPQPAAQQPNPPPPTLPPNHTAVIIRREDGSEYPAAFGGYHTQVEGVPPVISRWDPVGKAWSTGRLEPGETIIAGDVPPAPTKAPLPMPQGWDQLLERLDYAEGKKMPVAGIREYVNEFQKATDAQRVAMPTVMDTLDALNLAIKKHEPIPMAAPHPKVMTFEDFSHSQGVSSTAPSFPELHRTPGGVSKAAKRASEKRVQKSLSDWQAERDVLRAEYDKEVETGKIRPPTREEKLKVTAEGKGESAEAARRLLEKKSFPTELTTLEQFKKDNPKLKASTATGRYLGAIRDAIDARRPVLSKSVDDSQSGPKSKRIELPAGYVRDGEVYVYRPVPAGADRGTVTTEEPPPAPPETKPESAQPSPPSKPTTTEAPPEPEPEPESVIRPLYEIQKLLPVMGLKPEAQAVMSAFVNGPLAKTSPQEVEFLANEIAQSGWNGSMIAHAVTTARAADPEFGADDLMRVVWALVPPDLRTEFENMRVHALEIVAKEFTEQKKEDEAQRTAALINSPLNAAQFSGAEYPDSLWPYSSAEELFKRSANSNFKPTVGAMLPDFWKRANEIRSEFVSALKSSIDLNSKQRAFLDRISAGTFAQSKPELIAMQASIEGESLDPVRLDGEELRAKGIEQVKQLLNDPRAGLPMDAVRVALDLLDQPVFQSLLWSKFGLEIKNRIEPGVPGRATISATDWLISMTRSASPQTFPHEVYHILERLLPEADRERLEEFRLKELDKEAAHFSAGFPPGAREILDMLRKGITSRQFIELRSKLVEEHHNEAAEWLSGVYHLINPSEYFASIGGRKFAGESFDKNNESWFQGLITRLKAWLQGLIDALRRVLKRGKDFDQIYREVLSGKTTRTPEAGAQAERDVQMSVEDDAAARSAQAATEQEAEPWGTPGEAWVRTQVMGQDDFVRGREHLPPNPEIVAYAKSVFDQVGISSTWSDPAQAWVFDRTGFDQNLEFTKLLQRTREEIQRQREPGKSPGIIASLLNSIRMNYKMGESSAMADLPRPLRNDLYATAQGEISQYGLALSAQSRFTPDMQFVAHNVDVVLNKVFSDAFGGQAIRDLIDKVMVNFGQMFTESEIKTALDSHPNARQIIEQIIALNVQRVGSRLFLRLHNTLKPKKALPPATLERNAKLDEAYDSVIETLKREYGIEPKERPGKKRLTPQEKLALMVDEKTSVAVGRVIGSAVDDAEYNAGRVAMVKAAEREEDPQKKQDLEDHLALMQQTALDRENRIGPLPEYVEEGFQLPEFKHWLRVRENIGYSPTSMKLVQDVIRGQFKGTKFAVGKAMPKDTRLDLNALAKAPAVEVTRALDAFFDNVADTVEMGTASEETKSRVMTAIEGQIIEQLNQAMARARDPLFREPKAGTVPTADQRALQFLNAGLFADPRLNIPAMVERAAGKSAIQRLMPKVVDLTKQVFDTPFYRQDELAERFANYLTTKLAVDPSQVAKAKQLFDEAFKTPIAKAKEAAWKKAVESLTPKQRKAFKEHSTLEKIHRAFNAGAANPTEIINEIARKNGYELASDATVRRMRELSERVQRMQELTPAETAKIKADFPVDLQNWLKGLSPRELKDQQDRMATMGETAYQSTMLQAWLDKARGAVAAQTSSQRGILNREMAAIWARLERPIKWSKWLSTRKNIADAANEVEVANMLAKGGFAFTLPMHLGTAFALHIPMRAWGFVATRLKEGDITPSQVWSELGTTLTNSYTQLIRSVNPMLVAGRAALLGRSAQARNVDRLLSGVAAFDRLELQAKEADKNGETIRAGAMRLFGLIKFSLRFVQACDAMQGTPIEYQEIANLLDSALIEKGYTAAQRLVMKDRILSDLPKKYQTYLIQARQAHENRGEEYNERMLVEGAWAAVLNGMYDDIKLAGLPADDFRERIELLRRRIAWQEPVKHGVGGIATYIGKAATIGARNLGLPLSFTRFASAIGNGINYSLGFTLLAPAGFATFKLPGTTEESPYRRTEEDRQEFRARWIMGTIFGALVIYLVSKGYLRTFIRPPADKRERELWEKAGHRAGTVEIATGPDTFIPLSLTVGPAAVMAPYLVGAQADVDLAAKREKEQAKMDAEAAAKGLQPGKIAPRDVTDYLAIGASAAWGTLMGSKTFSGVAQSVTENASFSAKKGIAAYISPIVPGLPAYQQITRAMGWTMDPRLASVWDYLAPLPTSGARALNFLGEPVGTPSGIQRAVQTMTAGSYPWEVDTKQAKNLPAYETLFATGWRPPAIDPNKGYAIGGEWRPFNDKEMEQYTALRGENLRRELVELGSTDDVKQVQAAYQRANQAALAEVGVDLSESGGQTIGRGRTTALGAQRAIGQSGVQSSTAGAARTPISQFGGYRPSKGPAIGVRTPTSVPRMTQSRRSRSPALRRTAAHSPRVGRGIALLKRRSPALKRS